MKVKVRSGDSLWYYSQLFMMPVNLIADANPGINPASLKIGAEINIPGFTLQNYTVKSGDTFWKLSSSRNLSVDALLLVNQSLNPNSLIPGTAIKLPRRVISPIVSGRREYDYKALTADISMLADIYPFIKVNTIGRSVLGKPIQEIRLGKGTKKVHINASFHANEWITTPILMALLNSFLLSLTNVRPIRGISTMPLYNSVDLSIVPMVNPDGVDLVLNGLQRKSGRKLSK